MAAEQTVRIDGSTPIPVAVGGVITTEPAIPPSGDIVSGGIQVDNSNTPTTVITIPAGRTWCGSVAVVGSNADTTQSLASTTVTTAGTGVVPAAGTIIAGVISRRDSAATVMTHSPVYVTAPGGNAVTLVVTNSRATTYSGAASANGVLL